MRRPGSLVTRSFSASVSPRPTPHSAPVLPPVVATSRPTAQFTRHHDVVAPQVDAAAFRQGWRVCSRLESLLEAGRIAGGDLRGPRYMNSTPPAFPVTSTQPRAPVHWEQLLRYAIARDPALNYLEFDPEEPGVLQPRLAFVEGLIDVTTPDLSAFQARGGKLMIVQGLANVTVSPRSTIMWWDRLIARMGAPTVRQFARFYTVPGYGHGSGGLGVFNAAWDSLPVLDAWADRGTAPGPKSVIDANAAAAGRIRPLFVPDLAKIHWRG